MIFASFRRAIRTHGLLTAGDRVLAAVSGGRDSVALLHLLVRYAEEVPIEIAVAHVNHGLRGARSDEDQRFVEELCGRLGLGLTVLKPDSSGPGSLTARGEESARRVRHRLLDRAARAWRGSRIALGHTKDDQAETIMMRLMRGAGRRGLSGMAFAGPGRLIRPMLTLGRGEVTSYLESLGQGFREDETNADTRFMRNKVRSRLLPMMKEFNPAIVEVLSRTAGLLGEEDRYLDEMAAELLAGAARFPASGGGPGSGRTPILTLPARWLAGLPQPLARRVARLALEEAGGDPRGARLTAVEEILRLASEPREGSVCELAGKMRASRILSEIEIRGPGHEETVWRAESFEVELPIPGSVELPVIGGVLEAHLSPCLDPADHATGPYRACLDASLLVGGVTVRNRRPGDRFHPLGAPGGRKLKEFLIDCKVPRSRRERVPVVVGRAGIAWVVGHRIAHPYRVTEMTGRVAVLEFRP